MGYTAFPFPIYQPALRIISAITNASPALVTTTFAHQYMTGLIVRLVIPPGFGMQQLNYSPLGPPVAGVGTITVLSPTTFSINIDTTAMDPFAVPSQPGNLAQVIPIAEINSILSESTQNVLPYPAS